MKKKALIILLLIGTIGTLAAAVADLTGKWTGSVEGPDGNNYPLTYNFKAEGSKLTGTAETSFGTSEIQNGKIDGNDFSFNININGMDLPHKGKYYTDSVGLDVEYNGTPMHAMLKRAAK